MAVLAGAGALPRYVIEAGNHQGRDVYVLGFEGHTDEATLKAARSAVVRLGAVGTALAQLHAWGVTELIMAGKIKRPSLSDLRPDARGARLLARLSGRALGDDSLLRALAEELEREGFRLLAVPDILGGIVAGHGPLAGPALPPSLKRDARLAVRIARALGRLDIGQAAVVQQGYVLACEAAEGTDALCRRTVELILPGTPPVLGKASKPQQDTRLDLPAIGADTILACRQGGVAALVVEAGGVLLIDFDRLAVAAQECGIAVYGVTAAEAEAADAA